MKSHLFLSVLVQVEVTNCHTDDPLTVFDCMVVLGVKFDAEINGLEEEGVRNFCTVDPQKLIVMREKRHFFASGLVQVGVRRCWILANCHSFVSGLVQEGVRRCWILVKCFFGGFVQVGVRRC